MEDPAFLLLFMPAGREPLGLVRLVPVKIRGGGNLPPGSGWLRKYAAWAPACWPASSRQDLPGHQR